MNEQSLSTVTPTVNLAKRYEGCLSPLHHGFSSFLEELTASPHNMGEIFFMLFLLHIFVTKL